MLTDSQHDALSIAHTEISAIIKDLTERMKAKGYPKAKASVDIGRDVVIQLSVGSKAFRNVYTRAHYEFEYVYADTIPAAVDKACARIDALDDLTALNAELTGPLILAGGAS